MLIFLEEFIRERTHLAGVPDMVFASRLSTALPIDPSVAFAPSAAAPAIALPSSFLVQPLYLLEHTTAPSSTQPS